MPQDPGPTVVDIDYASAFGFHTARIHSRLWSPPDPSNLLGQVPRWSDDTLINLDTMIQDYIATLLPFFPATVEFLTSTVLTNSAPGLPLVQQASVILSGAVGSYVGAGWSKAVQSTINIRTVGNAISKFVLLDSTSFNDWNPIRSLAGQADLSAIVDVVTDPTQAFAGADNTRPNTWLSMTRTLNEALRKQYRMA